MDLILINEEDSSHCVLKVSDMLNHWIWKQNKFDSFSAWIDLIFNADDSGIFMTTKRALSDRWSVDEKTVLKWLRAFKKHKLIDYQYLSGRYEIQIIEQDQEGQSDEEHEFNDY